MKAFASLHPFVLLLYFIFTIGFSMALLDPFCIVISFICAIVSSVSLDGGHKAVFDMKYMLPVILLTAIINPAINHRGATILTYLPSGNPLTLESILYGAAAGLMLASVICHFSCFNSVMTSDKLIYLFGRLIPSLSLVFSMTLRLVPRFISQTKKVSEARRTIGRDIHSGSVIQRVKNGASIISVMISRSLESAIEVADSMKSRGYGLKGRTAFALYRFDKRDAVLLALILALGIYILYGNFSGYIYWRWFPTVKGHESGIAGISVYTAYAALILMCPLVNIVTLIQFKRAAGGVRHECV